MTIFLLVKIIHILSVSMMVGATLCNGVLHMIALRSGRLEPMKTTLNNIMQINRLIMAPAFVLIPASGMYIAFDLGLSASDRWLYWSVVLTIVLVFEFLIGYVMERKIETTIETSLSKGETAVPAQYFRLFKIASPIGASATVFSLVVIALMIVKP